MKKFECIRCHKYLGEMEKGKIHKEASILCNECMKFYKTCDSLASHKNSSGVGEWGNGDMGNMFKKIFEGK